MKKMYYIIIILSNTFSFQLPQLNNRADPKQAGKMLCWEVLPLTVCYLKMVQIHPENGLWEGGLWEGGLGGG